jgi:hypothetical protein
MFTLAKALTPWIWKDVIVTIKPVLTTFMKDACEHFAFTASDSDHRDAQRSLYDDYADAKENDSSHNAILARENACKLHTKFKHAIHRSAVAAFGGRDRVVTMEFPSLLTAIRSEAGDSDLSLHILQASRVPSRSIPRLSTNHAKWQLYQKTNILFRR